jgi:hypothetical protein
MVMHEQADWRFLDDDALLERRISTLGLRLEGTALHACVAQLHGELAARGLVFKPPVHIGDEWFCPEEIAAIFVPFYLCDERLQKLERKLILEVEGGNREECMRLLRHEAGHAYSYAYRLQRRRKWQRHFGLASQEYPETYRPQQHSRSFVIHLDDWYAQAHPDEDFAETFAVWLAPGDDWRERYRGWPALRKLEYVDELMCSLAGKPPVASPRLRVGEHNGLNKKLKTYYTRKRREFAESFPDFYDRDLRKLFGAETVNGHVSAAGFLRQNRLKIVNSICHWTREPKYRVNELLGDLTERAGELGLVADPGDSELPLSLASFITSLVMNHRFTGRFKHTR